MEKKIKMEKSLNLLEITIKKGLEKIIYYHQHFISFYIRLRKIKYIFNYIKNVFIYIIRNNLLVKKQYFTFCAGKYISKEINFNVFNNCYIILNTAQTDFNKKINNFIGIKIELKKLYKQLDVYKKFIKIIEKKVINDVNIIYNKAKKHEIEFNKVK